MPNYASVNIFKHHLDALLQFVLCLRVGGRIYKVSFHVRILVRGDRGRPSGSYLLHIAALDSGSGFFPVFSKQTAQCTTGAIRSIRRTMRFHFRTVTFSNRRTIRPLILTIPRWSYSQFSSTITSKKVCVMRRAFPSPRNSVSQFGKFCLPNRSVLFELCIELNFEC